MSRARPPRGVAQSGSAFGWGPKGRWFKSSRPDFFRVVSLSRETRLPWLAVGYAEVRLLNGDVLVVEGTLEYSPALPFYTGRRFTMVNGALNYFSIAASLPEARGLFLDTADLVRLWNGPQRVFLVVRRPRGQSVVVALPAARVHEVGRYGSRWLYSNR